MRRRSCGGAFGLLLIMCLFSFGGVGQAAGPLIPGSSWSGWAPWNGMCPCVPCSPPDGSCGATNTCRSVVGCNGTALAQLLVYHGRPFASPASASVAAANSVATTFGWTQSSASFDDVAAALVGPLPWPVAGQTGIWGFASASYCSLVPNDPYCPKEYEISFAQLFSRMRANLNSGMPVLLSLYSPTLGGGHTVICDGYQGSGSNAQYHLKMGWCGWCDGWYTQTQLQTGFTVTSAVGTTPVQPQNNLCPGTPTAPPSCLPPGNSGWTCTGVNNAILDIHPQISTIPPVAAFTIDSAQMTDVNQAQTNDLLTMDAGYRPGPGWDSRPYAYDPNGFITSYVWSFGDGNGAQGSRVTHSYGTAGSYTVTLTVTDNVGQSASSTKSIVVNGSGGPVGWVSPVSHLDPSGQWKGPGAAYDGDSQTWSSVSLQGGNDSSYLQFNLQSPGLSASRIRFLVTDSSPAAAHYFSWTVDVLRNGAWLTVYSGTPPQERAWIEVPFGQGTVTQIRVLAHNNTTGQWRAQIGEIEIR